MAERGLKRAAASLLLGTLCFALLPWMRSYAHLAYWMREPFYILPIPAKEGAPKIRSDGYGKGYYGASRGSRGQRKHLGVDLLAQTGEPVFASKSGRVFYAGFDKGYGHYVELKHPDGFSTRYAHLSQLFVRTGDWIPQGAVLGRSGNTGNADHPKIKPHLHFELRYGRKPLNPQAGWVKGLSK